MSISYCPSLWDPPEEKKTLQIWLFKTKLNENNEKASWLLFFFSCWQSAYCVQTWAGDHLSTCHHTNIKNWERGAERQLIWEHPSCCLSNACQPLRENIDKWSGPFGSKVHLYVQQCVSLCARECVFFRGKKSRAVRGPGRNNHITAAQRRWAGRGQGSRQQARTTAHQSVSAQTLQASYSQASESRTTLQNKTKGKAKRY